VRLSPIHGPILIISLLGYIIWGNGSSTDGKGLPIHAIPTSIVGLYTSIFIGMLLNTCWLLTATSVIFTVIVYLTYYAVVFKYIDYVTMFVIANTMIYLFIALYKIEKRDKSELLQFTQIRQMNEELKSILMNLPEGIILIKDDN